MKKDNKNSKEVKRRFQLWIKPSSLSLVDEMFEEDDCSSRSEYIEKAIIFYSGYLSTKRHNQYLPNVITSTLKSIVTESDNRMSKLLFKIAVELAMTMNVVAATNEIDEDSLKKLRGECVREVKRLNGSFSLDDAVDWQKE